MRFVIVLLLLIATSAILQPHVPVAAAEQATTELTLYAHTDPSATQVGSKVLSLSSNATSRHSADVRDGLAFVLVPPLSAPLRILGTISTYVWLQSRESLRGTLQVTLSEVTANASVTEIRSSSVTIGLPPSPYLVIFGLGAADHTLDAGSTLRFEARFSPVRPVPVMLLWDDPAAATLIVLQVEASPKIALTIIDAAGRASNVFPENDRSTNKLTAEVSVEDPFHGTNIKTVLLTVTNSTSFPLIKDAAMNLTSHVGLPFRLNYTLPIAIPTGRFNVTASVRDAADRTFLISKVVIVTRFYTLAVLLVDAKQRAVSGLDVSASALDWVEKAPTNSTGWASMQVPSSHAVGLVTLCVRIYGLVIWCRSMNVTSDSLIQIRLPLHDWTIFVKLQVLGTPIVAARVDLYLNDTFVASATTDANGATYFTAVPPGQYEVAVTYLLAFGPFNRTHLPKPEETAIVIPDTTDFLLVIIAIIAIIAVLGAYAASRRKTRRFKHVGELLGDAAPRPAVMMIVGPSGSGKTLLLQNLLADYLRHGRRCVYVSNSELPSRVRERLARMGLDAQKFQNNKKLAFVDAYSGATGAVSPERYSVSSARDLTRLGIQLTSCLEELGDPGDVFFDSLTSVVAPGGFERGFDFIEYYGARTKNSGGTFMYIASTTIEPQQLSRLEELSDCVLQTAKHAGSGGIRGRLLVKKARDVEHEQGWVGYRIRPDGRMEFVSLPSEAP